uniref:Uncharacterized protein n=1 Tax=Nelumbo nucifera TaxID=4432 RepID=A0A822Z9M8_NELNU|nr:TPA_asm: hypothetical protein HUJ06_014764 [Nelumbo nucifera]
MQVIYAGLVIASGGSDLTIWLLFGFVVSSLPDSYQKFVLNTSVSLFVFSFFSETKAFALNGVIGGKSCLCSGRNTKVVYT